MEIPSWGKGVLKAKFLEAMYENKLEFPGGEGGCETKKPSVGEYEYFLELHNPVDMLMLLAIHLPMIDLPVVNLCSFEHMHAPKQ